MWRKNRSPENVKTCAEGVDDDMSHGVDLNRNFDVQWMGKCLSKHWPTLTIFAMTVITINKYLNG